VADPSKLTLDLDPDNGFSGRRRWSRRPKKRFPRTLVAADGRKISANTTCAGSARAWRHDPAIAAGRRAEVQPGCPGS